MFLYIVFKLDVGFGEAVGKSSDRGGKWLSVVKGLRKEWKLLVKSDGMGFY